MSTVETGRLLKANDARPLRGKIAFNYADIQKSCDVYVQQARDQGRQLVETAQAEAEGLRTQAVEAGRRSGRTEGLLDAEAEIQKRSDDRLDDIIRDRLKTVIPALESVARAMEVERARWLTEWEASAIRLSVSIAEKILRRQLDAAPECGQEAILAAVKQITGQPHMRLQLHPGDIERLGERAADVIGSLASCAEVTLVANEEISPGGCVIETQHGVVDAQIETQLERIASELLQEEEEESG